MEHVIRGTIKGKKVEAPQINALNANTRFVTMTLGGNDISFADVMNKCIRQKSCQNDPFVKTRPRAAAALTPTLAQLYGRIHEKAPNAKLIVAGYPHLFASTAQSCSSPGLIGKLGRVEVDKGEITFLNHVGDNLNAAIGAAVLLDQRAGHNTAFVDMVAAFRGHEACANPRKKSMDWIRDIDVFNVLTKREVFFFHPNSAGQQAYATEIEAAIKR
jgi:hypothetical protein